MVTAYQGLVTKPQSLEKLFTPVELINCSKQQTMDCFSESKCCNAVQKLYLEGIMYKIPDLTTRIVILICK